MGLITKGMDGTDVMQSDNNETRYQIYQGKIGSTFLLPHLYLCLCLMDRQLHAFH